MRKGLILASTSTKCIALIALLALVPACTGGRIFSADVVGSTSQYSGYVVVSSPTSNTVSLFDASGGYVRTLRDLNSPSQENPGGLVASSADGEILLAVYGVSRIERIRLADGSHSEELLHSNLVYTQSLARDASGNLLVGDFGYYTIERFTPAGYRSGTPFIPTTATTCVIANPYSIAVASNGTIAVGNSAAQSVQLYNSDGSCLLNLNSAPFNANSPRSVAYDSAHGVFIVAFYTSGAIYSLATNGVSSLIYQDTAVVQNPSAVAVDSSGTIYVASTGYDTIEKLSFDGTTATRIGTAPFIAGSQHTLDVASILVVP